MKNRGYLIATLILLVFLLYYFTVRPEQIRKECFKSAQANAIQDTNPPLYTGSDDRIVRQNIQEQIMDSEYLDCVRETGLPN